MGKKWDYDVPKVEVWKEALRVLKPGGHILCACGTRTQHRMAVNIEDAGFDIRDIVAWVYGSGFPKSHNIGKAVDKLQGNEREVVGEKRTPDGKTWSERRPNGDITGYKGNGIEEKLNIQSIETKGTSKFEGWGTALKPAMELWTLARKPLSEKTVAKNTLKWGTAGINIDGCRVESEPELAKNWDRVQSKKQGIASTGIKPIDLRDRVPAGRFPANLIHDGSEEVVSKFPDSGGGKAKSNSDVNRKGIKEDGSSFNSKTCGFDVNKCQGMANFGDSGSASRFFYCAKASKSERNKGLEGFEEKFTPASEFRPNHMEKTLEGKGGNPYGRWTPVKNNHPTVKPVKLMQYLCRLITPKGGTILDPFMGSGSTGIGAKLEGFNFIGIELDEEYMKIAEARINNCEVDKQQALI